MYFCFFCIRFAGFDAVTLANNHLNDFGEKGANFTTEVLKKTGVKYIGVTYGKYDTSQVSITCSDIQAALIQTRLASNLCKTPSKTLHLEEIFCSVFNTLRGLLVSQIFVWGAKDPPAPPPDLCSAAYVLCYWKFAPST